MSDDRWLVRTSMNEVFGPISRDALLTQIREGKLGLEDEVCKANSYWIYLDEAEEVKRQLGIEMPRSQQDHEISTETDIQGMSHELQKQQHPGGGTETSAMSSSDSIEEDGTKLLSPRGAPRQPRFDRSGLRPQMGQSQPLILGRVEGPSIWRFVLGGLIILTGVMVAWVLRYLQTLP